MMNSFKKYLILAVVGMSVFTSCKRVLDVTPDTAIGADGVFTSAQKIEVAINGVYDAAQTGFYLSGTQRGYPFGAASIQQGDMRGEDMLNQALFYQITYASTQNSVSANQQYMFETLYSMINKANLFIEGVRNAPAGTLSADFFNQYMGEALFLRAWAHHELMIHFARPFNDNNGTRLGIIYRTRGVDSPEKLEQERTRTRGTVAQNYQQMISDLDSAEMLLPAVSRNFLNTLQRTYRAGKAAAVTLKMRAYMHMQNWAQVITEGNKLASQQTAPFTAPAAYGGHALAASPADPFRSPQHIENIFGLRNVAIDNPGVNAALATMGLPASAGGRGLVRISPIGWNIVQWRCDDRRRTLLTLTETGARYSNKYIDPRTNTDAAIYMRYAEVLLMMAEAEARTSPLSARALALLNAVRNRSLVNVATQGFTIASFPVAEDLVRAILTERRIEFLAEGKRWADIHRLALDPVSPISGIPAKISTGLAAESHFVCEGGAAPYAGATMIAAIPFTDHRFIWPIPLTETQQNPNFAQNPNY